MLSRKEFSEKKKYILERLKGKNSAKEEANLKSTLVSLMLLETENENLRNVRLYNIVNKLSNGKLTLQRNNKLNGYYAEFSDRFKSPIDDEYLEFLIQLAYNVAAMKVEYDEDSTELKPIEMSDEQKVELSKSFYEQLGSQEINEQAQRILSDETHFGFTDTVSKGNELLYGITVYDRVFNKPYITTQRMGNLMGCQAFNHEVMHGIDFYTAHDDIGEEYYGFHETPTYTIDYLFLDFMESKGFDKQQIDALRRKKMQYVQTMAMHKIIGLIRIRLYKTIGMKNTPNATIQDMRKVVDDEILKEMLELQSCVMAHALYQQTLKNKNEGLKNIHTLMSTILPADRIPDYSFVGLDRQTLLKVSESMGMIGNNTMQMEQNSQTEEISQGRSR